jgi:hypothetical protein
VGRAVGETEETYLKDFGSRLRRPMCGGGSAPPETHTNHSGATPLCWGIAPDFINASRKGTAIPDIGRHSRERVFTQCFLSSLWTAISLSTTLLGSVAALTSDMTQKPEDNNKNQDG